MERCADEYGVTPHVSLRTRVTSARWDEPAGTWQLETADGRHLDVDIVISALGMFNEPVLPDIDGLDTFAGPAFHSARWPDDVDLTGRRVAVIGSAASAVQLIPEVAKIVEHLTVFQRTAIWVLPKDDRPYTDDDKHRFRTDPEAMLELRAKLEDSVNTMMTFSDPEALERAAAAGLENLAVVDDSAVRNGLTPKVPWGSRRPIVSNVYYPTFNRDNVELVTEPIRNITTDGVVTGDGHVHAVDAIVLATGFATTKYLSAIEVTGREGVRLEDAWSDDPVAYLGVVTAGFPNLFMLYGPNTNNGSILRMLEYQVDFAVRFLQFMDEHELSWVDIRQVAMDHFNRQLQDRPRRGRSLAAATRRLLPRAVGTHRHPVAPLNGRVRRRACRRSRSLHSSTRSAETGHHIALDQSRPISDGSRWNARIIACSVYVATR